MTVMSLKWQDVYLFLNIHLHILNLFGGFGDFACGRFFPFFNVCSSVFVHYFYFKCLRVLLLSGHKLGRTKYTAYTILDQKATDTFVQARMGASIIVCEIGPVHVLFASSNRFQDYGKDPMVPKCLHVQNVQNVYIHFNFGLNHLPV